MMIKNNYEDVLVYEDGDLLDINIEKLMETINKEQFKQEYRELIEILG